MDAQQARRVQAVLRQLNIPGVVAPEDPNNPAGAWRVYNRTDHATRCDVTADALAALAATFPDEKPAPGPKRGFVIPTNGEKGTEIPPDDGAGD
ncbi:hypothetical protein [Streptomyces xiamenensis]|uniref:hypothetical protein n=1 Tax=Streptomyces xiamenensis TaxID=408015 RepID=UPI0035DDE34E